MTAWAKLYIALFIIIFAAGLVWTVKYAFEAKARAEEQAAQEMALRIQREAELEAERVISDAKAQAGSIARDSQIQNAINADRRIQKANADKIRETSERDPEKYTEFVEKVDEKNIELFNCISDLRNEKDCIGHIR